MTTPLPPWAQYLDQEAFLAVHRFLHGLVSGDFLRFANELGNGYVLVPIILAVVTLVRERRRAILVAAHVALAMGVGGLATHSLKTALRRDRPFLAVPAAFATGEAPLEFDEAGGTRSFPSGHTGAAFAWTMALYLWARDLGSGWRKTLARSALIVLACATGLARVYFGAHFLLDVLAGAAIGWAAAHLAGWTIRRFPGAAQPARSGQVTATVCSAPMRP
jgi:undecaprenyl-diphosphatase